MKKQNKRKKSVSVEEARLAELVLAENVLEELRLFGLSSDSYIGEIEPLKGNYDKKESGWQEATLMWYYDVVNFLVNGKLDLYREKVLPEIRRRKNATRKGNFAKTQSAKKRQDRIKELLKNSPLKLEIQNKKGRLIPVTLEDYLIAKLELKVGNRTIKNDLKQLGLKQLKVKLEKR